MKLVLRSVIVIMVMITLSGCSSFGKKDKDNEYANASKDQTSDPNALWEVDLNKAAKINVELAMTYLEHGQVSRAKKKLNHALKLGPNLPMVHYSLAYYYERAGEIKDAEDAYMKAVQLDPMDGKARNNYGAFLCRHDNFREAEKQFMFAVKDPEYLNTAEAYENAGLCVMQIPDYAAAEAYFEKALRINPNRTNSLLELAYMHYEQGKTQRAQQYYQQYVKDAEPTSRSLWLGAKLAERQQNQAKTRHYKALLNSQFPNSHENLSLKK